MSEHTFKKLKLKSFGPGLLSPTPSRTTYLRSSIINGVSSIPLSISSNIWKGRPDKEGLKATGSLNISSKCLLTSFFTITTLSTQPSTELRPTKLFLLSLYFIAWWKNLEFRISFSNPLFISLLSKHALFI